MLPAIVILRS